MPALALQQMQRLRATKHRGAGLSCPHCRELRSLERSAQASLWGAKKNRRNHHVHRGGARLHRAVRRLLRHDKMGHRGPAEQLHLLCLLRHGSCSLQQRLGLP